MKSQAYYAYFSKICKDLCIFSLYAHNNLKSAPLVTAHNFHHAPTSCSDKNEFSKSSAISDGFCIIKCLSFALNFDINLSCYRSTICDKIIPKLRVNTTNVKIHIFPLHHEGNGTILSRRDICSNTQHFANTVKTLKPSVETAQKGTCSWPPSSKSNPFTSQDSQDLIIPKLWVFSTTCPESLAQDSTPLNGIQIGVLAEVQVLTAN